jgi:hypothetical protein
LDYGFAVEANEWDYLEFEMALNDLPYPSRLTWQEQQRLLLEAHLSFQTHLRVRLPSGHCRHQMKKALEKVLPYVRCHVLPGFRHVHVAMPISCTNEKNALACFTQYIQHACLEAYPTTIADDEAVLTSMSTNSDLVQSKLYVALVYRIQQKRILMHSMEVLEEALQRVESIVDPSVKADSKEKADDTQENEALSSLWTHVESF